MQKNRLKDLIFHIFIIICFFFLSLENDFQESRCIKQIENLRECCKKFHETSLVCSGMKPIPVTEENQNINVGTIQKKIIICK